MPEAFGVGLFNKYENGPLKGPFFMEALFFNKYFEFIRFFAFLTYTYRIIDGALCKQNLMGTRDFNFCSVSQSSQYFRRFCGKPR